MVDTPCLGVRDRGLHMGVSALQYTGVLVDKLVRCIVTAEL